MVGLTVACQWDTVEVNDCGKLDIVMSAAEMQCYSYKMLLIYHTLSKAACLCLTTARRLDIVFGFGRQSVEEEDVPVKRNTDGDGQAAGHCIAASMSYMLTESTSKTRLGEVPCPLTAPSPCTFPQTSSPTSPPGPLTCPVLWYRDPSPSLP